MGLLVPHHPQAHLLRDAGDRRAETAKSQGPQPDPPRAQPPLRAIQMPSSPPTPSPAFSSLPGSNRLKKSAARLWQGVLGDPKSLKSPSVSPTRVRTRRAATCSTKPRVCAGAGCDRKDPVTPSVSHSPGSPQAHTTPNSSAHIPSRNSGGSRHSGRPRAVTYFPVSPLQPQPQPRPPEPLPRPAAQGGRRPQIPAVKMQRAKRVVQTMVPGCSVPSSGNDRALRARTAPPLPGWLPREPGGEGGSAHSAPAARACSCG